jgi:hypothetical protein
MHLHHNNRAEASEEQAESIGNPCVSTRFTYPQEEENPRKSKPSYPPSNEQNIPI